MSTEELPADLDKLKITTKMEHTKLCDRNPFYSPNVTFRSENILAPMQSTKQIIHCKTRRIRRSSESNIDDFNNKQLDSPVAATADSFEICVSPLRFLPGVNKLQLKRSNITPSKRNMVREPVLRITHDNLHTKCGFGTRIRRSIPLNLDERNRASFHKPRVNINIKSSIHGICSFRDLISECNILLDESKSKKETTDNIHMSKNFITCQQRGTSTLKATDKNSDITGDEQAFINRDQCSNTSVTSFSSNSCSRLSCSQEAGNSGASPRNCDDVTIVELASYFDTMVHIPKKMSSMAEMMYI
ncbi:PREDICTED: uncharacterized protein LOC108610095 [Drosophila arizonae]|uniref:Oxidative stress-responsive serine-rich protein 1 n=1 Tax=Drosophila arizonae TaxID=7263 RepID=A0ABM1NR39_DROAR|nr:PREDICTED: uncharacterized protein LOC108610095 [Drosophila arizonae]